KIPNINENGELVGINSVTSFTYTDGIVIFDSLKAGSYTVIATLIDGNGEIVIDEWGNPIRKLTGVTIQGSGTYEVIIIFDYYHSINKPNLLCNVKLYPVPSNNTVTIESPVNISRIVISNIVGQMIQTIENPMQIQTISVANFATGVYMITLFDNNGNSTTQRFIKQ
ncbi:MAG TPA: T9SS type A sorting domain-containing protein, partial [Salinivirgaceae bacterium]|nr:T9SS type A sorting domain-containing protein [Salinivirgaceae bacterium]